VTPAVQVSELTGFRAATVEEVLAVHRPPYVEMLHQVMPEDERRAP